MSTLERVKKVFSEIMPQTDLSRVTLETSVTNDLGVDSLKMVMLAIALEDEFQVRLDFSSPFQTVGDVVSFLDGCQKEP